MERDRARYDVHVTVGEGITLEGILSVPHEAIGIVLFAHGSGSSRHSPRNGYVAQVFNDGNLATLLIDLLTEDEARLDLQTRRLRFNIELLADRLGGAMDWMRSHESIRHLAVGLYGASTGGGAALVAAARRSAVVKAVVSRGVRLDMTGDALASVRAPTLLIVGGADDVVINMNREALERLQSVKRLELVRGATHLFEEPGALAEVARLARDWFIYYLAEQ